MKDLAGKVAVITGGASGIGFATARALSREGVKLVLADIEDKALEQAAATLCSEGAEAIGVHTDVGDRASVERLADTAWARFGGADIVFNNAGIAAAGPTHLASHADWEWTMRVNVWGPIHGFCSAAGSGWTAPSSTPSEGNPRGEFVASDDSPGPPRA
jgi:NAD(P)-dependent dehydrogenase (short-subunit alcohol dehydrogenase family)